MPIHNNEIADDFDRLADLLEIEGANQFRVRAYRDAARTVRNDTRNMADRIEDGEDLSEIAGIGEDLAEKIKTIVETGELPLLEEVRLRVPDALSDLMRIEGLGPKRVKALYHNLDIETIDDLKDAAENEKIQELEGFGRKTEHIIKERVERFAGAEKRTTLLVAEDIAESLVEYLKQSKGLKDIVIAGSYRRCKETVGDLDILVTAKKDSSVMKRFVDYDEVIEVILHGKTRSTVRLRSGMHVDLRVVPEVSYGSALHYFTGSKAHNIGVRKLGMKKGYKINEYGVFKNDKRIAGKTEKEVYEKVGLCYVPPELREGRGEIEAAKNNALPDLVTLNDIRGDLHCHTTATDGHNSLKKMTEAARERGYEYIAFTDHSKHVTVARGLDKKRLLKQIDAIDRLNDKLDDIVVLKSIELDILEDGSLDLPDSVLKKLDFTVCSVHYKFHLSSKKQTERILRAMDNPCFTIFGHPTGRQINEREPYQVDIEKIIKGAVERGCFLEVNANASRLDLNDDACKLAKDNGLKVAISTDAHSVSDLDFMRFGLNQARRGWMEAKDVINTLPLKKLRKLFQRG
ncbi:DNA polymerase/3'-5' exonuclease PolX [Kineobactrum sediminis]|uniref:DNA polymerase beta n=1 Tax=Kineobactrum sediminis TaxID=1905677 RepID=A0A2N5Y213_9GAMM|nr:DNA polymerase/3'-5' exonuclease PolX [Kineobactrum sediminis]PLW82436.1 DNA polymerase/3'-5' exonuclease PolX [Kineobactrum sediminis]